MGQLELKKSVVLRAISRLDIVSVRIDLTLASLQGWAPPSATRLPIAARTDVAIKAMFKEKKSNKSDDEEDD